VRSTACKSSRVLRLFLTAIVTTRECGRLGDLDLPFRGGGKKKTAFQTIASARKEEGKKEKKCLIPRGLHEPSARGESCMRQRQTKKGMSWIRDWGRRRRRLKWRPALELPISPGERKAYLDVLIRTRKSKTKKRSAAALSGASSPARSRRSTCRKREEKRGNGFFFPGTRKGRGKGILSFPGGQDGSARL